MLNVKLHLCNGEVLTLTLTRSQRDRLSRTLNRVILPDLPFEVTVQGNDLLIPWRSIAYLSTPVPVTAEQPSTQAAD